MPAEDPDALETPLRSANDIVPGRGSCRDRVAITGIGQSAVGRKLAQSGLELTVDAALEAIDDAGLTVADVDGLGTYAGHRPDMLPFSPVDSSRWRSKTALG